MSDKINEDGMAVGAGTMAGYQLPLGMVKRHKKLEKLLKKRGIMPEAANFVFKKANPVLVESMCVHADADRDDEAMGAYGEMAREAVLRELIRKRIREIVRKKQGGGGYVLYRPNKGKKKPPKAVGEFPTKFGAKKAELSRFPPRDLSKLQKARKAVDKMAKDPKKRADAEARQKREKHPGKKYKKAAPKRTRSEALEFIRAQLQEAVELELFGEAVMGEALMDLNQLTTVDPDAAAAAKNGGKLSQNWVKFSKMSGGRIAATDGKKMYSVWDPSKRKWGLPPGTGGQAVNNQQLAVKGVPQVGDPGVGAGMGESLMAHLDRVVTERYEREGKERLAQSISEALFHEERDESAWDDIVSKLPQKVASADKKLQQLQKGIAKKAEAVLNDAFKQIQKATKKSAKMKSFGVKHDTARRKTYLAFSATFDNVNVEPMYIYIEGGVPKLEISEQARAALTKVKPKSAKSFRAELIMVQERVLDRMDDLVKAVTARDRYLEKTQDGIDDYVSGLNPLQLSLLKQLLVKKYRKLG